MHFPFFAKGGLHMTAEKEKIDLPKRKSSFLRRTFFIVFFLLIVIPFVTLAFVIRGGALANDAVFGVVEKYFSHLAYLSVDFVNLSGNPFEGYTLEGLTVGDKTTPDIITVEKLFVEIDTQESWTQRKIVLCGSIDGLRTKESKMNDLLVAAKEEFQLGAGTDPFTPLTFVVPKNFKGINWAGDSGWNITEISLNLVEPENLIYKFFLDAEYQEEGVQVECVTELNEGAIPLWADLRLRAHKSEMTAQASLENGRISLKNIDGTLLDSLLNGSASIDLAQEDPEITADFSLGSVDLGRLRKFVPDLGPTTVENLTAHVSGTLAHPLGEFSLKNGTVEWQAYKFSNVGAVGFLDGKDLSVKFSATALGATFEASGNLGLTSDSPLAIEATVTALQLRELEKFFPELESAELDGVASAKITAFGSFVQPTVHISLLSPKISLQGKSVFSDVNAAIVITESKLTLQNFSSEVLKGKISATGSLTWNESSPSLTLSGNLSQLDLGTFGDVVGKLDGNFSIGGTVARPQINLEAKIDSLNAMQFAAKNISLTASGCDVLDVRLQGFTKMNTPFGGGGEISLRGARSAMNLKFGLDRLNLSELFPYTMRISGEVSMVLLVSGTFDNPSVSAVIRSPEILAGRYKVAAPQLKANLNGQKIDIDASVAVGDRRPSARGTLNFQNGSRYVNTATAKGDVVASEINTSYFAKRFKCVLDIAAPDVRIDFLAPSLAGKVYGRVTMRGRAVITESGIQIIGSVTSPMLGASGIRATNIIVPFTFKDKKFEISNGILVLGGGRMNLDADGDLESGTYSFALRSKNIDLKKLTASSDLPAQVEGNAEMTFGGRITSGFTTLVRAGGQIHLKDISIDKFHGQTAIIGNSPLKIENGNIFFKIDDDEVYLMPGSAISAPFDDKIYNFISFSGTLWKIHRSAPNLAPELLPEDLFKNNDDMYNIFVNGSINLRVLNGLLSGFGAVMDAGVSGDMSTENIASNFLERYIKGRFGTHYRAFELNIAGKDYRELRINNLKFESEGNFTTVDTTDWRKDSGQVKDFQRYSFNYGLPVGRDPLREEKKKARQERTAAREKRKKTAEGSTKKTSGDDSEN